MTRRVLSPGNDSVMVVRAEKRLDFTLVKYIMIMGPALLFVRSPLERIG